MRLEAKMRAIRWAWYLGTGLVLVSARPAAAQQPLPAAPVAAVSLTLAAAPAPATLGPTFSAAQLGLHQDVTAPTELNRDAFKTNRREGRILTIVGGAALIAGLLIGGDAGTVIAIGGAGVGLYGLYVWQR